MTDIMAAITVPRDRIFTGWTEEESSRVVGVIGDEFSLHEEEPRIGHLRKWIAHYHSNEALESYFYSVKKVCPMDEVRDKLQYKERLQLILVALLCIGVSFVIFWKSRSYFESKWKECQAIASKNTYVIRKRTNLFGFDRYATAQDIWEKHPTAGAKGLLFLRNAFCFLSPFLGPLGLAGWIFSNRDPEIWSPRKKYNLIIERSKDSRTCPSNFDINNDLDPMTQEPIPREKLHSPQMIYLPNYVTEAKNFVLAVLVAGKKNFSDPVYRTEFSEEARKQVLSQIERIFLISEKRFNECFDKDDNWNLFLDYVVSDRFETDSRVIDQSRGFSQAARSHLDSLIDDIGVLEDHINAHSDGIHSHQLRERATRVARVEILRIAGYINVLKKNDKAKFRVSCFKNLTGVSLAPEQEL